MNNIQAITYLLFISTFLVICCSGRQVAEALEDSSPEHERRSVDRTYFDQFVAKRAGGRNSICSGHVQCGDECHQGTAYDSTTSCSLLCLTDDLKGVGHTGTCQASSTICGGAKSTFCPGGTFTIHRNVYPTNPNYFDCDNGYGCGDKGGCCVRVGGFNTGRNQHFCLTCNK